MIRKKPIQRESIDQQAVITWANQMTCQHPELAMLFAIPNGARVRWATAVRLKKEGLKRGVPDLFLPVPRAQYHGCFIEMKAGTHPAPLSVEQKTWIQELRRLGYGVWHVRGFEQARHVLLAYLELS